MYLSLGDYVQVTKTEYNFFHFLQEDVMAKQRKRVGRKMTRDQLIMTSLQARGFLRSARSLYNHIRENKFKKIATADKHFIMQGVDGTIYSWGDMNTIHVNIGFCLELILKRILYYDCGEIRAEHYDPSHKLSKIYDALSTDIKEYVNSIFSETVERYGYFHLVGMMIKYTRDMPDKPKNVPLNSLSDILKYIDNEDMLYGKRYECFSLEKDKWYFFIDNLEPLFFFLEKLLWLHKKDVHDESDV